MIKKHIAITFLAILLNGINTIAQEAHIVSDIYNGYNSSNTHGYVEINGTLYFNASTEAHPHHIWTYNGVTPPVICNEISTEEFNYVYTLGEYNGSLIFIGNSNDEGEELYIYDGNNSPVRISNLKPGVENSFEYIRQRCFTYGNKFYIVANDGETGMEWWVYDGTNFIYLLADMGTGLNSAEPSNPIELNNKLYFRIWKEFVGYKLWEYDGTNPPEEILEIGGNSDYLINSYLLHDDQLYLELDEEASKIWKYNGIDEAILVTELTYNNDTLKHISLTWYNEKLCMLGINPINTNSYYGDLELWECDETGTSYKVSTLYTNDSYSGIDVVGFEIINNKLVIALTYEDDGGEVCVYNGTDIEIIASVPFNGYYQQSIISVGDTSYFQAYDETNHVELWGYNGITEPFLISNIKEGDNYFNGSSNPMQFIEFNNSLLFTADDGIHGREIWTTSNINYSNIILTNNSISLFPNPTNGDITLQSKNNSLILGLNLFSITGNLLESVYNINKTNFKYYINFPAGIYILELETKIGKEYLKVEKCIF